MEKRSLGDGSLIWVKTCNPSSSTGYDIAADVAVDESGVYIIGYDSKKGNYRWRMEKRSLSDGSLIWLKTCNPSSSLDWATGVAVDRSGVYIVGSDSKKGNMRWRMEKRSLSDGSLMWLKTSNPSSDSDDSRGVSVDGAGLYVVGSDNKKGNERWRMEKHSLGDGSLIWLKTVNPTINYDSIVDVASYDEHIYVFGRYSIETGENIGWRIEKRYH
jgi:hypothetical protein